MSSNDGISADELKRSQLLAEVAMSSAVNASFTIVKFSPHGDETSLQVSVDTLRKRVRKTLADDKLADGQKVLAAQAHTLDTIFNAMAQKAAANAGEYVGACEKYLKLALRAQSQCRATLETIADIKHPRTATFVNQTNVANGPQQVNNSRTGENENQPNELLEDKSDERVDFGAEAAPGGDNTPVEALGEIERSKK